MLVARTIKIYLVINKYLNATKNTELLLLDWKGKKKFSDINHVDLKKKQGFESFTGSMVTGE